MPSYYIPQLNTLVSKLNTACGYSGRYTLVRRIAGVPPDHGGWAIMKKEGQLDRNVSGWATPLQLRFWVQGHLEGFDACLRRGPERLDTFSPTGRLTEKQPEPWHKGNVHGTKIP